MTSVSTRVNSNNIVGKAYMFWIKKASFGELGYKLLDRCRLKPSDVLKKEEYDFTTCVFMECWDIQEVKNKCRGCAVALWVKYGVSSANPKLGVVVRIEPNCNYIELLIWRGLVQTTTEQNVIPTMFLKNRKNWTKDDVNHNFFHVYFPLSDVHIIFLKQVSGYSSYMGNVSDESLDLVDGDDGCYDVGVDGPTVWSLPSELTIQHKDMSDIYRRFKHFNIFSERPNNVDNNKKKGRGPVKIIGLRTYLLFISRMHIFSCANI